MDSNDSVDGDTYESGQEPSGIWFPDVHQTDPRGGFTNVPDACLGTFGLGVNVHPDGDVTTLAKQPSGGGNASPQSGDGGTP